MPMGIVETLDETISHTMSHTLVTVKHLEVETGLSQGVFNMMDDAGLQLVYLFWMVGISLGMY